MPFDPKQTFKEYIPSELLYQRQWEMLGEEMLYRGGIGLATGLVLCTVIFRST